MNGSRTVKTNRLVSRLKEALETDPPGVPCLPELNVEKMLAGLLKSRAFFSQLSALIVPT